MPKIKIKRNSSNVIGVAVCGDPDGKGAPLEWIDGDFNVTDALPSGYFNNHPSFCFPHAESDGNHFRSIPLAWWKRGVVPEGKPNAGNWYMMISDAPIEDFSANGAAFRRDGALKDRFLFGSHRAYDNDGKPGSAPAKPHWGGVSFEEFKARAESMGDGCHMLTLQEYHEVLARAVIEKKTFGLWPWSGRRTRKTNGYRGIEEIAYHGATFCEWRDGARVNGDGHFEVLDSDGSGDYVNTGVEAKGIGYIGELLSGPHWDHMFVASETCDDRGKAMIPGYTRRDAGYICYVAFYSGGANNGAFNSRWNYSPWNSNSAIGGRLAKI